MAEESLSSTHDDPFDTSVVADLEEEYEILGELGRGGSAIVYRARDRALGREVAIKVVQAGRPFHLLSSQTGLAEDVSGGRDDPIARLAREARTVAKLQHPNVVSVHAIRRLNGDALALVMQFVPGRTLKDVVREEGPLAPGRAEAIVRDIARALSFAHARGVIHRDVKPENIFLDAQTGRAMLSDFGIARLDEADTRLTQTGTTLGTPAYMSPEQIAGGQLDGRADLYSLGLVAWEMLTGRQPWEGLGLYELLSRQKSEVLPPIEAVRPPTAAPVSLKLQYVVERMLQKNPGARWAGAEGLLTQLDHSVLPGDYRRWVQSHQRRVEVARRAATPTRGAAGLVESALATVRITRSAIAQRFAGAPVRAAADDASGAAEPDWGAERAGMRPALLAAIVVVVVLAAGAALFALRTRRPTDAAILAHSDAAAGTIEVPVRPPDAVASTSGGEAGRVATPPSAPPVAPPPAADTAPSMVPAVPASAAPSGLANVRPSASAPPARALTPVPPTPYRGPPTSAPAATVAAAPTPATPAGASPDSEGDDTPVVRAPITVERGTIAAGGRHTCALGASGRASCWGANDRGQLGEDDPDGRAAPGRVSGDLQFAQIAAGVAHTCGVTRGGDAYCWGNDENGQLGDATTSNRDAPVRVAGGYRFRLVRTGLSHTCGVTAGGAIACWGLNADGQLGDGTASSRGTPATVAAGVRFATVSAGWRHTCALSVDGVAYCWGSNENGQLGDGGRAARRTPAPVGGALRFVSIAAGSAHTCAVATTHDVYCWGRNNYGQLGVGSAGDRAVPTRVESSAGFASVVAGSVHTCGLTLGGAIACWGRNVYGQLGDGSTTDRATPVRVTGGIGYVALSASGAHTCGAGADGSVACWGYNVEGQLGDGTRNHRSTPTKIDLP